MNGNTKRFDLYIRFSLYGNFVAAPLLAGPFFQPEPGGAARWVAAGFTAVHAVVCVLLVRAGIDHYLGRRARPVRLIALGAALTVAGALILPSGRDGVVPLVLVMGFLAALSTAVRPRVALAVGAVACALAAVLGDPGLAVFLATLGVVVVGAFRVSVWTLGIVWELDRSREVRASLAVAEERLRFARDLHDVVGRTLSVVALKAELAAQLAKRGRAEAVDEMLEVRRVAQDSLAELRAVVGGYRSADLDAELAGARSLLASAGVGCRVIGDGAGLPPDVQGVLGWVVREGTTNVLRHSEARECVITLRTPPDSPPDSPPGGAVTLTMDNDGAAAPAPARFGSAPAFGTGPVFGSGLVGLAERVASLGGAVTAERPAPDRFRLTARLPVARDGGLPA